MSSSRTPPRPPDSPDAARPRADLPPCIIHIPHASAEVPPSALAGFAVSQQELSAELLGMTDHFTDELFSLPIDVATPLRSPVSRLVVDVERFRDDEREVMSKVGMGAVYTRTADGRPLRHPMARAERRRLLASYYAPHHRELARMVRERRKKHGWCLIIDAHSFPSEPRPYQLDQDSVRPDYCIGTDTFHTPEGLVDVCRQVAKQLGRTVAVNKPYSGTMVPAAMYHRDPRVLSVMIEVNRRLYMNEDTGVRNEAFKQIQDEVSRFVYRALAWSARTFIPSGLNRLAVHL